MSYQGSRRSSSQNKNQRFNPISGEYESIAVQSSQNNNGYGQPSMGYGQQNNGYGQQNIGYGQQNNGYGQNSFRESLNGNIPTIAAKEILRQSYPGNPLPNQNNLYGREVETSPQRNRQPTDNSNVSPPTNNDFYRAIPNGEDSKHNDRKNRYKEVLGKMMEQEKEKKDREKAMHKQGTSIDQHTWNTFIELEKAQEQEEKRRVKELLLKDLDEQRKKEKKKENNTP